MFGRAFGDISGTVFLYLALQTKYDIIGFVTWQTASRCYINFNAVFPDYVEIRLGNNVFAGLVPYFRRIASLPYRSIIIQGIAMRMLF